MNQDVITVGEKSTADIVLIWFHGYGANNWGFEPFIKLLNLNLDGRLHVVMPNAPIDDGKRSWYPLPTTENGSVLFVPESHKGEVYDHHYEGYFAGAIDVKNNNVDLSKTIEVIGKAGTISIHHARLLHASNPKF